jgi:hypothetical protein
LNYLYFHTKSSLYIMIVSEMGNKNNPSPLKNRIITFQYRN